MLKTISFLIMALAQLQPAQERELPIANDRDSSTDVRLFESADAVRFEFSGPHAAFPTVAIDVQRNGTVDPAVDFEIGFDDDANESPCFQKLISETRSTDCFAPGDRATVTRTRRGSITVTTFSLPKRQVSGDGFGFGFALNLWNEDGKYWTVIASGDYRFGGHLDLISDGGPNFKGQAKSNLPPEMLNAKRRYEACLWTAIRALEPLDKTKVARLKAIPAGCASDRATALTDGVAALVASGVAREAAEKGMTTLFDHVDKSIVRFAEKVETGF